MKAGAPSNEIPNTILVAVQVLMPPKTNPNTLLVHLSPTDAQQLHAALSACLKGIAN